MIDAFKTNGASPPQDAQTHERPVEQPIDFTVANHGSIFLLTPQSPAAAEWLEENLPEDRQTWGDAVVVEHRLIYDIVLGAVADGLWVG